jgi:hypothetical protein
LKASALLKTTPMVLSMWHNKMKMDGKKIKTCHFGSTKWFWPNIFSQKIELHKRHSKAQ